MKGRFSHWIAVAGIGSLFALAGCASPLTQQEPSSSHSVDVHMPVRYELRAAHLKSPWSMVLFRDYILVSERDQSRIAIFSVDGTLHGHLLIEGVVAETAEGGLLGLAISATEELYVYSTAASGNRVQRYVLSETPEGSSIPLALGEPTPVIEGIPAGRIHHGGRLAFGPDEKLYVSTGDAGDRRLPQDLESLAGKILRLNPDGSIPIDNPFPNSTVYSHGHRNVQGLAWDSHGRMYATELGANQWDELNMIEPGNNYGWPDVEGTSNSSAYTDPVMKWQPARTSPSSLFIHQDTAYIANLRGQNLTTVELNPLISTGEEIETVYVQSELGRLRDVVVHEDGTVWLLTSNTGGGGPAQQADDVIAELPATLLEDASESSLQ